MLETDNSGTEEHTKWSKVYLNAKKIHGMTSNMFEFFSFSPDIDIPWHLPDRYYAVASFQPFEESTRSLNKH